jgi:hypothetical protein
MNSAAVCSSNGQCTAPDTCSCNTGYSGATCQSWTCFGLSNLDANVCNAHGSCTTPDTCVCSGDYSYV